METFPHPREASPRPHRPPRHLDVELLDAPATQVDRPRARSPRSLRGIQAPQRDPARAGDRGPQGPARIAGERTLPAPASTMESMRRAWSTPRTRLLPVEFCAGRALRMRTMPSSMGPRLGDLLASRRARGSRGRPGRSRGGVDGRGHAVIGAHRYSRRSACADAAAANAMAAAADASVFMAGPPGWINLGCAGRSCRMQPKRAPRASTGRPDGGRFTPCREPCRYV